MPRSVLFYSVLRGLVALAFCACDSSDSGNSTSGPCPDGTTPDGCPLNCLSGYYEWPDHTTRFVCLDYLSGTNCPDIAVADEQFFGVDAAAPDSGVDTELPDSGIDGGEPDAEGGVAVESTGVPCVPQVGWCVPRIACPALGGCAPFACAKPVTGP